MMDFDSHIKNNSYPGRGIIQALSKDSKEAWQIYWIMGRSTNSRNRVFKSEGTRMYTEASDPSKLEDPSLVIYEAMLEAKGEYLVSNGDQTRTVYQSLLHGGSFESALFSRDHEPDAPNYTPRISASISMNPVPFFKFSIIKSNTINKSISDRNFYYKEEIEAGYGYCITTYLGDGSPIPSFNGEPFKLELKNSAEASLDYIWENLDNDNKVSCAIKKINIESGNSEIIINNKL